jgi:hypothetical protein
MWIVALAAAAACCGAEREPAPAEALLTEATMVAAPWPSDVFLRQGRLEVGAIPLEAQEAPLATLAATLADLDGAPNVTSVFFPVRGGALRDGPLDGTARFVDLDAPEDAPVATRLHYRAATHEVVALAAAGVVLPEGHRIACVVEAPGLAPSRQMREAIEGRGPFAAAYAGIAPALAGRAASAATVFTVGHATRVVEAMREVAARRPPPRATVERVYGEAELDTLLGAPGTTRPGLGDPAGVVHDALGWVILGSFGAPSFLTATPPAKGKVDLDDGGIPIVKGEERIPFMLTLPRAVRNVPVLVFQHGLNASRAQVAAVANDYARAGYATIGVDAIFHGERAPRRKDLVHNFGGSPGPDGLADPDDFGASLSIFNFDGDPAQGILPFDGRYVRDALRQAIVDLTELARFVSAGDLAAVREADPGLAELWLDASTLVYTSESFGSLIGASALAVAPELQGGVLSVGGAGIFLAAYPSSPLFNPLITPFLRATFDATLDVSELDVLPAEAQRSLSLVQAAIAPGDPVSFAPKLRERGKHALFLQARSDELIPNQSGELLAAAAGATFVSLPVLSEPPRFATLPSAEAPFTAPAGEPTLALVQLSPALHTMFTGFTGERRYEPSFPPFVALSVPEIVDGPIELAHELAITFADSLRATGAGQVGR